MSDEEIVLASDSEEAEETRANEPGYWTLAAAAIQEGRAALNQSTRLQASNIPGDAEDGLDNRNDQVPEDSSPPRKRVKVRS